MARNTTAALIAFLVAGLGARVAAAKETATLEVERGKDAGGCPDESKVREAVAQRLGYDPFVADGQLAVVVRIRRERETFSASLEIREPDGKVRGARTLSSQASSCDELATALVVSMAIALDPARFMPPKPPTAPAPSPPSPPPAPDREPDPFREAPEPAPPAPPPPAPPWVWALVAGGGLALGAAPSPAAAFAAGFGGRVRRFSVEIEGRVALPAGDSYSEGDVSASSMWLGLVPCFHFDPVAACAMGAIGDVRGRSERVAVPTSSHSFAANLGVRGYVELPLSRPLFLRAGADATASLQGTRLTLAGREVWISPTLGGLVWSSLVVHFP